MNNDDLNKKVMEARGYVRRQLAERDAGGAIHRYMGWVDPALDMEVRCRDYENSMDACMELLEEMAENEVGWQLSSDGEDGYMVVLLFATGKTWQFLADTLPKAICEAYLAWWEGKQ